jgi:hypothetical protein
VPAGATKPSQNGRVTTKLQEIGPTGRYVPHPPRRSLHFASRSGTGRGGGARRAPDPCLREKRGRMVLGNGRRGLPDLPVRSDRADPAFRFDRPGARADRHLQGRQPGDRGRPYLVIPSQHQNGLHRSGGGDTARHVGAVVVHFRIAAVRQAGQVRRLRRLWQRPYRETPRRCRYQPAGLFRRADRAGEPSANADRADPDAVQYAQRVRSGRPTSPGSRSVQERQRYARPSGRRQAAAAGGRGWSGGSAATSSRSS